MSATTLVAERISLNQAELRLFAEEIVDEMIGFGPIEPLLKDPTVNDILINTHKNLFCRALRQARADARPFQGRSASCFGS